MPEGDVVWRTAQRLHAALSGRDLVSSDLRWPSLADADLSGRHVIEVVSAGKHLLTRLAATATLPPVTLHSHLRMEGSWALQRTGGTTRRSRSADGTRAILVTDEWTAIGHKLGMLDLVPTSAEGTLVGHLGPDLLGAGWDADRAVANLLAAPERGVGEALLDQRVLAGVGTYFMSESLFVRGVTPWTPVSEVPDPEALVDLLHRMLSAARGGVSQSTTGEVSPSGRQWVHSRSGRPCRRCGATVRVALVGRAPQERTAFYCPTCQHGPAPTDDGRVQRPLGAFARAGRRRGARSSYR